MKLLHKYYDGPFYTVYSMFGMRIRIIRRKMVKMANKCPVLKSQCMQAFGWHLENTGYAMDWENPKTLTEKMIWLWKYYYSRLPDFFTQIHDKEAFKDWVCERIGEGYTVKLLGAWDSPHSISWGELPDKFVLKSIHGGCGRETIIVENKFQLNIGRAIKQMSRWNHGKGSRVIAEELLQDNDGGGLHDYKFFCFNGKPQFIMAFTRTKNTAKVEEKIENMYDTNWAVLPGYAYSYPSTPRGDISRPKNLEKMLKLAEKLSNGFPLIRVDMYSVGDKIYIGELTQTPMGGLMCFDPIEYDRIYGDMLELPEKLSLPKSPL